MIWFSKFVPEDGFKAAQEKGKKFPWARLLTAISWKSLLMIIPLRAVPLVNCTAFNGDFHGTAIKSAAPSPILGCSLGVLMRFLTTVKDEK